MNRQVSSRGPRGFADRTEKTGFVRRAHRKLIHVRFAENNRAGSGKFLNDRRVVRRNKVFEHFRTATGFDSARAENVFVNNRQPFRSPSAPLAARNVCPRGGGQCFIGSNGHERIELVVVYCAMRSSSAWVNSTDEKSPRSRPADNSLMVCCVQAHHSITFGTR